MRADRSLLDDLTKLKAVEDLVADAVEVVSSRLSPLKCNTNTAIEYSIRRFFLTLLRFRLTLIRITLSPDSVPSPTRLAFTVWVAPYLKEICLTSS